MHTFVSLVLIAQAPFTALAGIPPEGSASVGDRVPAFYFIDAEGRSAREDPLASGFALAASASSAVDTGTSESPKPVRRTRKYAVPAARRGSAAPSSSVRIVIRSQARNTTDDRFAEYRCERHGFFYTRDGRCVVPAFTRTRNRLDP